LLSRCLQTLILLVSLVAVIPYLCAEQGILVVHVKDARGQPIAGLEIGTEGDGSAAITLKGGIARITLAKQTKAGSWVSLQVLTSPKGRDLVMISPWDGRALVPPFENESDNFVPVVVIERGDRAALENGTVLISLAKTILAQAKAPSQNQNSRAKALDDVSSRVGLSAPELDMAIRSWDTHTEDPEEKSVLLDYRGNGVSNEESLWISSAVLVPFVVPQGHKLTINGLSSNNLTNVINIDPPRALWAILRDVKAANGNCGKVVASGETPAKFESTGRVVFSVDEFRMSAHINVDLEPGEYWVKFVPQCTNPQNPGCTSYPRFFLTQLELNTSGRLGTPPSCGDTYMEMEKQSPGMDHGGRECVKTGAPVGCAIPSQGLGVSDPGFARPGLNSIGLPSSGPASSGFPQIDQKMTESLRINLHPEESAGNSERLWPDSTPEEAANSSGGRGHETRLEVDELRLQKINLTGTTLQLRLSVIMKNVGKMPAHDLYVFGSSGIAIMPRNANQERDIIAELSKFMQPYGLEGRSTEESLPPGSRFSFTMQAPSANWIELKQLQEGNYGVYYTGIVLGNAITRFCLYMSGDLSNVHRCTPDAKAVEVDENAAPGSQLKGKFFPKEERDSIPPW
jgi:hypothetical protein